MIDGLLEEAQNKFALAESIVVLTKEDYKILTKRILTTLQYAASIDFPSPNDFCEILGSEGAAMWPTLIVSNLGVKIEISGNISRESTEIFVPLATIAALENHSDDIIESNKLPLTFYDMNDITLDHVLHGDPWSYKVIEKLVQYMEQAPVIDEFDNHKSSGEMPVCWIISPATADRGLASNDLISKPPISKKQGCSKIKSISF